MARTASPTSASPCKPKAETAPASRPQDALPSVAKVVDELPWTPGPATRASGRTAIADADLETGSLVLREQAVISIPRASASQRACHACLRPMSPPAPKKKAAAGEAGSAEEAANPMLPRYCSRACAAPHAARDAALSQLRERLWQLSKDLQIDPELLHLVAMLDLPADDAAMGPDPPAPGAGTPPLLRAGPADLACLPSSWDKRPAPWRKAVGAALRTVHRELAALAAGGSVAGYTTPSSLLELQARAAMVVTHLVSIGPPGETGLGLFPCLASFSHSCIPNCIWIASGDAVSVRTMVPVEAGTPLTLSFAPLYEPRAVRRQTVATERGITCNCERCTAPLATSTDRFLEGVWCLVCRRDVLVEAADQVTAAGQYEAQAEQRAARARQELRRQAVPKHGKRAGKGKAGKPARGADAAEGVGEEQQGQQGVGEEGGEVVDLGTCGHEHEHGGPCDHAHGKEGAEVVAEHKEDHSQCCGGQGHGHEHTHAHGPPPPQGPGLWWQCCGCGAVAPGVAQVGVGPEELTHRAALLWQQGLVLHNMKAYTQCEQVLRVLGGGLAGRLHPLHARVMDALTPLLNINIQRADTVAVFNLALQLWEAERTIVDRPTLTQLTYLSALVEAAQYKATHAKSSVVRRQFDRKYRLAQSELVFLRKIMLGAEE